MGKEITKKIFNFIKKKGLVTIDEIKKEFPNTNLIILDYHLKKLLEFDIKKVRRGIYCSGYPDIYYLIMKLNKDNIIAYHTALEFYGFGHTEYFTKYATNPKKLKETEILDLNFKFLKPISNHFHTIKKDNKEYKITTLEATFLECLINPKYCGGFEEFYRCISSIRIEEKEYKKNSIPKYKKDSPININYLLSLLESYKIEKLYNLLGFILESLKENFDLEISDKILKKIKKNIRKKTVILEESYSKKYEFNKKWNIKIPIESKSIIEGYY